METSHLEMSRDPWGQGCILTGGDLTLRGFIFFFLEFRDGMMRSSVLRVFYVFYEGC